MNLRPVHRNTLPDEIIDQIKGMIAEGAWKPGDRIPSEWELVERFQVGRTTVREALKALSLVGLLTRSREGTFVNKDPAALLVQPLDRSLLLGRTTIEKVFEARYMFEADITALAVLRGTPEDLEAIRQTLENVDCTQPPAFRDHDVRFHTAIANAAHNEVIRDIYIAVRDILFQTYRYYDLLAQAHEPSVVDLLTGSVEDHRRIYAAIVARNEQEAREAVQYHFERVESLFLVSGVFREQRLGDAR